MVITHDHINAQKIRSIDGLRGCDADINRYNDRGPCRACTLNRQRRKAKAFLKATWDVIARISADASEEVKHHCCARCTVHVVIAVDPHQLLAGNGTLDTINCCLHTIHFPGGMEIIEGWFKEPSNRIDRVNPTSHQHACYWSGDS